jgi:hypothetical protein
MSTGTSFRQAFGRNPVLISSLDPGQSLSPQASGGEHAGVTGHGGFLDTLLETVKNTCPILMSSCGAVWKACLTS